MTVGEDVRAFGAAVWSWRLPTQIRASDDIPRVPWQCEILRNRERAAVLLAEQAIGPYFDLLLQAGLAEDEPRSFHDRPWREGDVPLSLQWLELLDDRRELEALGAAGPWWS